jgi:hypothetical protein
VKKRQKATSNNKHIANGIIIRVTYCHKESCFRVILEKHEISPFGVDEEREKEHEQGGKHRTFLFQAQYFIKVLSLIFGNSTWKFNLNSRLLAKFPT